MSGAKLKCIDWIPNSFQLSITEPSHPNPSASVLFNSKHVGVIFKKWADIVAAQFRRRAFVYHYTGSGMDEMEFT